LESVRPLPPRINELQESFTQDAEDEIIVDMMELQIEDTVDVIMPLIQELQMYEPLVDAKSDSSELETVPFSEFIKLLDLESFKDEQ
jgi:hypothetical protein